MVNQDEPQSAIGQAPTPMEPVKAAAKPPRGGAWGSLLRGLLGFGRLGRSGRVEIRVARLVVDDAQAAAGIDYTRQVVAALEKQKGIRVRPLGKTLELNPFGDPARNMAGALDTARKWLAAADADLLIWGEVPAPGTTFHLRFAPSVDEEEDRPGVFNPFTALNLPVGFGPEYAQILLAVGLAATVPRNKEKLRNLHEGLATALFAARGAVNHLPVDLTSRERSAIRVCFANAAATLAGVRGSGDLFQVAAQFYQEALESLSRDDHPLDWGIVRKHQGEVFQALAERNNDTGPLEKAADAYTAAARILTRNDFPRQWASIQNRLGQVLYRLELKTGDTEVLKHALTSFQSALQVITRADNPQRWAEVMCNLAQVAHELGGHIKNPEVLEKAVEAFRSALEVRTRESAPQPWAATQNNLGTSLFMLGKLTANNEHLSSAAEAFGLAHDFYTLTGAARMAAITEKNLSHVKRLAEKKAPKAVPRMQWEKAAPNTDKE